MVCKGTVILNCWQRGENRVNIQYRGQEDYLCVFLPRGWDTELMVVNTHMD